MINDIDDLVTCPACAREINVLSRRCPYCTTEINTVATYIIVPGSVKATILSLISAFISAFIVAAICDKFGVSAINSIISCIVVAFVVDWRVRRHGIGRTLVTTAGNNQTSVKQR